MTSPPKATDELRDPTLSAILPARVTQEPETMLHRHLAGSH